MLHAFLVKEEEFPIGSAGFVNAVFSSVSANLEPGWGERFPVLMLKLYQGDAPAAELAALEAELGEVMAELEKLPGSRLVWDYDKRELPAALPEGFNPEAATLRGAFTTTEGKNFFAVLEEALARAKEIGSPLLLGFTPPAERQLPA